MRGIIYLLVFLLVVSLVSAGVSKDYGYVKLTVVNQEPVVTDVSFATEVMVGNDVSCDFIVDDERPGKVSLRIEWYVNEEFVEVGESFSSFNAGDMVECLVTPTDEYGLTGTSMGLRIEAIEKPNIVALAGEEINNGFEKIVNFFRRF